MSAIVQCIFVVENMQLCNAARAELIWLQLCCAAVCAYLHSCFAAEEATPHPLPPWRLCPTQIESPLLRRAAKLKAAYQNALSPRLLVPVGLGVLIGVYNRVSGDTMPVLLSGCLLLGFLSHKVALVIKLVDDLSPKVGNPACRLLLVGDVTLVVASMPTCNCGVCCVWSGRVLYLLFLCAVSIQAAVLLQHTHMPTPPTGWVP